MFQVNCVGNTWIVQEIFSLNMNYGNDIITLIQSYKCSDQTKILKFTKNGQIFNHHFFALIPR